MTCLVPADLFHAGIFFAYFGKKNKMSGQFSHLDANNKPTMVDVSSKKVTKRTATAQAILVLTEDILRALKTDKDISTKKGPIFQTAILAGIMGAKKTADLIPLCHPIGMEDCSITIEKINVTNIKILCTTSVESKTGVEMEALTGASIAALTIYDMCKSFSHDIIIKEIKLLEKTGGKKDFKRD